MVEPVVQSPLSPIAPSRAVWLLWVGWLFSSLVVMLAFYVIVRPDLRTWQGMITHGNPQRAAIALTFDDGPNPLWAPLLADTLERHGARGTFFVVGSEAQRYPELVARLARAGHEVGNHSMTHPQSPNLAGLPRTRVEAEVLGAAQVLENITGDPVRDFRPPGGGLNDTVIDILRRHDMRLAWWSYNTSDYTDPNPERTIERLRDHLHPGLIALLHERKATIAAMEGLLSSEDGKRYSYITFTDIAE